MTIVDVLENAKAYLTPTVWAQGSVSTKSGRACAMIAIDLCAGDHHTTYGHAAYGAYMALKQAVGAGLLTTWNDSHTYEEVMKGFDKAIQLAREQETKGDTQ